MTKITNHFIADVAAVSISDDKTHVVTPEGYLDIPARIARTGIQYYHSTELGMVSSDETLVAVYRPPEEVFAPQSMASFAAKPVTLDHPPVMVDSSSFKDYAVGFSSHEIERQGDHLTTRLTLMEEQAIAAVHEGQTQLSIGYFADYEFTEGETPEGQSYQVIQRNIRGNHIALVDAGRCGGSCRVGDCDPRSAGSSPAHNSSKKETTMTFVTIDGQNLDMSEEAALAVQGLMDRKADLEQQLKTIEAAPDKVLSTAELDRKVEDRLQLITAATVLAPGLQTKNLNDDALRLAVLQSVFKDENFSEKSPDYLLARFDGLLVQDKQLSGQDSLAAALSVAGTVMPARDFYLNSLTSSWKGK